MSRLDQLFKFIKRIEDGLGLKKKSVAPSRERVGKWRIYHLPRRFDAETSPNISGTCGGLLDENAHLIIDFSDTVFLGSAGLAALLNINHLALQKGGALRLASCSEEVNQVIKMARFDKVFSIYQNVVSAASEKP